MSALLPDGSRCPELVTMTPRAQMIAMAYYQMGREAGWLAGHDHAEEQHWGIPSYDAAAAAIIRDGLGAISRERSAAYRPRQGAA